MLDLHRMGDYCALADFVMAVYNEVMFHDICHFQHSNTTGPNFKILFSDVQQKAWIKEKCLWCTVEIKYCFANELNYCVLWWLITSWYAVFKLCPGLLSTHRVNKPRPHINYFSGNILDSFALSEKRMEYSGTEIQEKKILLCIPLSRLQKVGKQLLLKGKLTFKIKPATSTESKITSFGDGRGIYHFWIKN